MLHALRIDGIKYAHFYVQTLLYIKKNKNMIMSIMENEIKIIILIHYQS